MSSIRKNIVHYLNYIKKKILSENNNLKIEDNWINNNVIKIPLYNIENVNISNIENYNSLTLDIRNINKINNVKIYGSSNINKVILRNDQICNIEFENCNDTKIVIYDSIINKLEENKIELLFNSNNGNEIKKITIINNNDVNIHYYSEDYERNFGNIYLDCKSIVINKELKILYSDVFFDKYHEQISSSHFNNNKDNRKILTYKID